MSYDLFVHDLEDLISRAERGELVDDSLEGEYGDMLTLEEPHDVLGVPGLSSPSPVPSLEQRSPSMRERELSRQRLVDQPVPAHILLESNLTVLGGSVDHILTGHVFFYLHSMEITRLSLTCKFFQHLCNQPTIWEHMLVRDFYPFPDRPRRLIGDPRRAYLQRYQEYRHRIIRSKDEISQLENEARRAVLASKAEQWLDLTQLRLCAPILLSSAFLTITLYCQKVDGLDIPLWSCAVPLAFSFLYILGSFYLIYVVQGREYDRHSIFKGMWPSLRGPLVSFYQTALESSPNALFLSGCVVALLFIQLGCLVVKLSLYLPDKFRHDFSWGLVFLPSWILLAASIAAHFIFEHHIDVGLLITCFLFIWIPLAVLLICLTVKLDYHNDGPGAIRLTYILIPFFFIEAAVLLWSLVLLAVAYVK